MLRMPIVFLLFMIIINEHQVEPFGSPIGDTATVTNFANDALAFVKGDLPLENFLMGSTGFALDTIINKMTELSNTLTTMEENNERRMNHIINKLVERLPLENKVATGFNELSTHINRVDSLYKNYLYYIKDLKGFDKSTLMDYVNSIISHKKGDLQDTLESLDHLISPGRSSRYKKPILELVQQLDKTKSFGELCGLDSSPQQRIFEIYHAIVITEGYALTMYTFSYAMLTMYRNVSYASELKKVASQYVLRSQGYLKSTKKAMEDASIISDLCDPEVYERGDTYVELEQSIQMFVVGEEYISQGGSCAPHCESLSSGGLRTGACQRNTYGWCPVRTCDGRIFDCASAGDSTVCELPSNSVRRYGYVKDQHAHTYGNDNSCSGMIKNPNGYTSGVRYCDVCVCTCADERGPSNRTISFRKQTADIDNNMVVTGVRLVSLDKIVQIQIKEGELMSGGRIKPDSEHWVDLQRFGYDPNGGYRGRKIGTFYTINENGKKELWNGVDFTFITFYQRTVNLDDIIAPVGSVVTGVKFMREMSDKDGLSRLPIQLQIRVTKFNYTTGELDTNADASQWISQENMPMKSPNRRRWDYVTITEPDDPTKMTDHDVLSKPGQCVLFTTSDRVKDAGQATVPFFDGQKTELSVSTALSGLGLVHRGAEGSGGFIAFRLFTLDLPKYVNTELTPEEIEEFKSN